MLSTTELTVRIPAVQGAYGHRLMTYSTQITPRHLEAFLGHDPRSRHWRKLEPELEQIYKQLQRTTAPERLRSIQTYIKKRFSNKAIVPGAFPSISVAVKKWLRFEEFQGSDLKGAGTLHLDMSKLNSRIVLDGLARVSAVIELAEFANYEGITEEERQVLNRLLDDFTLPMVVFSPRDKDKALDLRELRQLFADFNFKQTSISPTMAMAHDSSDLYVEATKRLAEHPVIKSHGGMETRSASLGKKSTALVVLQNLVRFVRGAAEGDRFTEAKMNVDKDDEGRRLNEDNLSEFVERVNQFLSGMEDAMGSVRFSDTKNAIHLTGPGWGALGVVFHDLDTTLGHHNLYEAGRRLGEIDWQKTASFWSDIMREKDVRGKTTMTFVGGGYESRQALRRKLHEHLATWEQLQAVLDAGEQAGKPQVEASAA
jgi:DGQHR domain-containing protein